MVAREARLRLFQEVGLAASLVPRTVEGEEYDTFVALRGMRPRPRDCVPSSGRGLPYEATLRNDFLKSGA